MLHASGYTERSAFGIAIRFWLGRTFERGRLRWSRLYGIFPRSFSVEICQYLTLYFSDSNQGLMNTVLTDCRVQNRSFEHEPWHLQFFTAFEKKSRNWKLKVFEYLNFHATPCVKVHTVALIMYIWTCIFHACMATTCVLACALSLGPHSVTLIFTFVSNSWQKCRYSGRRTSPNLSERWTWPNYPKKGKNINFLMFSEGVIT